MAAQVVADSGVFIAIVMEETFGVRANRLVRSWSRDHVQVIAPVLFQYEIVAVIRKNVYRGLLSEEEGIEKRDLLFALTKFIQYEVNEVLLRRAYDIAQQFNRPTAYDSQYLALAEQHGCEFWTADERLFNTVHHQLNWVRWLGALQD